ncbi:MAG TPA: twin-arginine translocase TatA/TatE family subunit [Candidatus Acidoferrum sp.]|jgi:sec-independent protein translocase protein TatA|nr:twin-arginine translocase TatA/TatE family subunit [Candidatus Acidoferrum sp.]
MIGSQDLLVGLAIVLVLFGAKKLPELAASLGKSMKEFKKGVSEAGEEEPPRPAGPSIVTAAAPRPCPVCKTSLEPDWSHCPRCGTAAPGNSAPGTNNPA